MDDSFVSLGEADREGHGCTATGQETGLRRLWHVGVGLQPPTSLGHLSALWSPLLAPGSPSVPVLLCTPPRAHPGRFPSAAARPSRSLPRPRSLLSLVCTHLSPCLRQRAEPPKAVNFLYLY